MGKLFRYNKFMAEFPFLKEIQKELSYLDESFIYSVKKVDENFLRRIPEWYYHNGSAGVTYVEELFFSVDRNGKLKKLNLSYKITFKSNYAHTSSSYEDGNPIWDSLNKCNDILNIKYLILISRYYSQWVGQPEESSKACVIYKSNNLKKLVEKILKEESIKIKSELSD